MVMGVLSGIVSTLLLGAGSLVWRHRTHLSLLRTTLWPRGTVRVSFSAVLRVKDDDRYVLVGTTIPGFFGPPGGVVKFQGPVPALDQLGFHEQRADRHRADMRDDLRGFVPARSLVGFVRWFATGSSRETGTECLRRELVEELVDDDGVPLLHVPALSFALVRTAIEGPRCVVRQPYRQLRRVEVYDLVLDDEPAARFRRQLLDLADDPDTPTVRCATRTEITTGWTGTTPIAPHAAYLFGGRKLLPDPPPLPFLT